VSGWRCSVDTGGTFTDCLLEGPDGEVRRAKVLSTGRLRTRVTAVHSPVTVAVAPFTIPGGDEGWLSGKPVRINGEPCGKLVRSRGFEWTLESAPARFGPGDMVEVESGWEAPILALRLLLGGEPQAQAGRGLSLRLGTTKGTNALLENKGAPTALFLSEGFADLLRIRDQKRPDLFARAVVREAPMHRRVYGIRGRLDAAGTELAPLDTRQLAARAAEARAAGCVAAAVCFLHSWKDPRHERAAATVLRESGFSCIRLSSGIRPLIHYLERAETTLVDATLGPVMDAYLDRVEEALRGSLLWIMTSAGGLVSRARFHAVDSLVSGPAGGLLGAVAAGRRAGMKAVIALDMGGTSTDVSRWKGRFEPRQRIQVGAARLLAPAMPIETVAAGGGSICGFDGERLFVGPESAGADPGPAAYGAGGPLTLTDIHLLLGRMDPRAFSIPIRMDRARAAIEAVARAAGEQDWQSLAEGFLAIATERMAHAIRQVSLREGEDPAGYGLVAFGGAGGLHACRAAGQLGIRRILFPAEAGLLSARGIHEAPREAVVDFQYIAPLDEAVPALAERFTRMEADAAGQLRRDGVAPDRLEAPVRAVHLRLLGQESSLPLEWPAAGGLEEAYRGRFVATFGYFPDSARLEVVKLRLILKERVDAPAAEAFPDAAAEAPPVGRIEGFVNGRPLPVPVFDRAGLEAGMLLPGPAIVRDPFSTCFIEPGWTGRRGGHGSIEAFPASAAHEAARFPALANVEKALILNRLETLVEEMGDQLRRTALSTNIRERLDFSCALLDARGRLLVNAPHIPVHLGAMGLCVRECTARFSPGPGDVLMTNHPACGGSHLPDITLLCGIFDTSGRLAGYLANRAHHAELGGRSPGSMPPDAACLAEEGVIMAPQWLVRDGSARFDAVEQLLRAGPYPSRAPRENLTDLQAQLAALRRGCDLFAGLLADFRAEAVRSRFAELHAMAAEAVAAVLRDGRRLDGAGAAELDDGRRISVAVHHAGERLTIDFSGTSAEHPGNFNATPAIVRSAVLYVLRLLVDVPMPLNEGLLEAVEIRLPRCFLNPEFPEDPSACPAVVGGNVETSQKVVEALLRALGLMAGGQGTMNNLLFGNTRFGYYETIGGGAGAGDGFPGASGVHVHMTNTAITDPEILEQRFPVLCREFSLRGGSGGAGVFRGGDGLVRELAFREAVTLSLLAQSRVHAPRGLAGGGDGAPGRQWRVGVDGSLSPAPGVCRLELAAGEGIRVETPGGGGWGASL
jgi:5-oxoprolinase (ATP-hydrolysing)